MVEDFAPYRAYIASLLVRYPQVRLAGEAFEGLQAIEKARQLKPDIILMDVGLPLLNGIEAARQIQEVSPHSRILFLSQEASPELVAEAIKVGAWGYVFKSEAQTDLLVAIGAILTGDRYFSPQNGHSPQGQK